MLAGILPAEFTPGKGYQLAYLAAADGSQALVYLRNVAGGIVNVGEGRACYLRRPEAAEAAVSRIHLLNQITQGSKNRQSVGF